MKRNLITTLAALASVAAIISAACGDGAAVEKELFDVDKATTTASGLRYTDEKVGTGATPTLQQSVTVHYTGKLASNGTTFDSSVGGDPATFAMTGVIQGFAEAISTMKVGGKRTAYIPAALGYGARAQGPIPANSDLIFEIELIAVK